MELIIDFYKSLDALNLIIFWGIIIVIILLLIFSFILINKNKKLKKIVKETSIQYEEELPIKKEEIPTTTSNKTDFEKENTVVINNDQEENLFETSKDSNTTEPQIHTSTNEHPSNYNHEKTQNNDSELLQTKQETNQKQSITMPTGPYQRNVLREMSLSQTSPIGINRKIRNEEKKVEMVKDLEESLNVESTLSPEPQSYTVENDIQEQNDKVKKELSNIDMISHQRTEIQNNNTQAIVSDFKTYSVPSKNENQTNINTNNNKNETNSSEAYLEEVSKKLAEAEITDEIERTNYELQQEEEAIISYKELMEKKDSIQTIDEEEAVISIAELMNRDNKNAEESTTRENSKLYNLTEKEENDDFIKELKQFRKDL